MARVVENIATNLRAMVPEAAIRRLIELEVRAAMQALPQPDPPSPQPGPQPSSARAADRISYRVDEAAKLIGVSTSKVWGLIGEGRLPALKLDGVRLIRRVDLEAFIDAMLAAEGGRRNG